MTAGGPGKGLSVFERYLSVWVALCIVAGIAIGRLSPALVGGLSRLEVSHVNLPIAVLIWLMIYPMMLRIDFAALRGVGRQPRGIFVVLFVNWLVKPFSMAFLGWLFFKHVFAGMIGPALGDQYLAGTIILAAAPCTAMVFVWSYLTDRDPAPDPGVFELEPGLRPGPLAQGSARGGGSRRADWREQLFRAGCRDG